MINLHPFVNGNTVTSLWSTVWGPMSVSLVLVRNNSACGPQQIGLKPQTWRKSPLENRACRHDNWTGDLTISSESLVRSEVIGPVTSSYYPTPISYTRYTITPEFGSPTVQTCTVLVAPSGEGELILPQLLYTYRGNADWTGKVGWKWSGNKLYTYYVFRKQKWVASSTGVYYYTPVWTKAVTEYRFATAPDALPQVAERWYKSTTVTSWNEPDFPTPIYVTTSSLVTKLVSGHADQGIYDTSLFDLVLASSWLKRYIPPTDINMWGDLTQECVHDAQALDINSMQFVRELFQMKESLLAMLRLLRGKVTAKTVSKFFLGLRYGLNLTVKDTKEISDTVTYKITELPDGDLPAMAKLAYLDLSKWVSKGMNKGYRYCRAQDSRTSIINSALLQSVTVEQQYFQKIYYDPVDTGFRSLIRKMMDWDVFPTMQNIWDMVPLTFVLDWFVDFDNYFDIVDTGGYVKYLQYLEVIKTERTTFRSVPLERFLPLNTGGWKVAGVCDYTFYHRMISAFPELPRLKVNTPTEFRNFAELAAIVIVSLK